MVPSPAYSLFNSKKKPLAFFYYPQMQDPMFFSFFIFATLTFFFLFVLVFSLYNRFCKSRKCAMVVELAEPAGDSPTQLAPPLLLEGFVSDSQKCTNLLDEPVVGMDTPAEEHREMKKRKKGRKKKNKNLGVEKKVEEKESSVYSDSALVSFESACSILFSSSCSSTQRKIKHQYEELMKCVESNKLTVTEAVQFDKDLTAAINEQQQKTEAILRKLPVQKTLLCKASRSTINRIQQELFKLESEQKRLEDDSVAYNLLQEQLKHCPLYQKLLELGASMEKEKLSKLEENSDDKYESFEEFLEREKKDSFWQKRIQSRSRLS